MKGKLYLIPAPLGEGSLETVIPSGMAEIARKLKFFIVENERTARRYLKKIDREIRIEDLQFIVLDEHTKDVTTAQYLGFLEAGHDVGLMSEAGCPAIADPGAAVVALAQQKDIQVIPLVGPSSILMAFMASGFNGQSFAFNGYLPVKPEEKLRSLKNLEKRARTENQPQAFIETPYRNLKIFDDLLKNLLPDTKLCVAVDITQPSEFIRTKTIREWRNLPMPDMNKKPAVFIIS